MKRKMMMALFLVAGLFCASSLYAAEDAKGSKTAMQRFVLDDVEVIAIQDLATTMDIALFSGPASDETRKKYMPEGTAKASVNVFVVKTHGKTLLVDAGYGSLNPGSGLMSGLADLGIKTEMVDGVLLTHMHPDHIGGLVTEKGERVFPKAALFVSDGEYQFWVGKKNDDGSPPFKVAKAYGKDIKTFAPGDEPASGMIAFEAPGHTPGHTAFLLRAGNGLLFVGDLLHAAALQFPLPDECAKYDQNPAMAVRSRKAVLFLAAANKLPIAGAHLPFPGLGRVEAADGEGFRFLDTME